MKNLELYKMTKIMDNLYSGPRLRFTLSGTCVFICLYYKPISDVKQCISTNKHLFIIIIIIKVVTIFINNV